MTLKKRNIIIFFTILLYLVGVNSQKSTLLPPSPTTSSLSPSTTLSPDTESCSKSDECINSVNSLKQCNAYIKTPDEYIKEGIRNGTYKPESRSLSKCMCNSQYYDTLSKCVECFDNLTKTEFKVAPLEEYEKECSSFGTKFTETKPPPSSGMSLRVKLGLIAGLVILVVGIIGFIIFRRYRGKKKHSVSHDKAGGDMSDVGGASKYPPPQPPSTHYQYAPPTEYPPPSGLNTPPSQSATYYPPPPPQNQPHGSESRGQSESYYSGNF